MISVLWAVIAEKDEQVIGARTTLKSAESLKDAFEATWPNEKSYVRKFENFRK